MLEQNFEVKENKVTAEYGEFIIEPLEPGYGHTVGNALRRVLLASIPGVAVTSVKINGVKHRFSTLTGLKENIVDFLLNLKGVHFRFTDLNKTNASLKLSAKGQKKITSSDIDLPDGVEILNKDWYLGALADSKSKLEMEITVEKGLGYSLSEERKISDLGVISTDAIFTPVKRVNYVVEATRVGRLTNLDKLVIQIWTNGAVTPKEALKKAAEILTSYSMQIYEPKSTVVQKEGVPVVKSSIPDSILKLTIDELDLPTRIYNSLRNGGVETIGQLIVTPRKDLMNMRNMGGKSLSIIEEKLKEKGISLTI